MSIGSSEFLELRSTEKIARYCEDGGDIEVKDSRDRTLLLIASEEGKEDIVDYLLSRKANIFAQDNEGRGVLELASANNRLKVINILLKDDVKPDSIQAEDMKSALWIAAEKGHQEIVGRLLDKGAYIESRERHGGTTPLCAATHHSQIEVINLLLDRGARINAVDAFGRTPAEIALRDGHREALALLMRRGATPWN